MMDKYVYQNNFSELYADFMKDNLNKNKRVKKSVKIVKILQDYLGQNLADFTILDVGCSTGHCTAYVAQYVKEATGTDIDKAAISTAKLEYKDVQNVHFLYADSMNLPFEDDVFDVVICTQVYEHVPDSNRLMDEIHRVLKSGGCCYFAATQRFVFIEPHHKLPLLSWMPKKVANVYMRLMGKNMDYYENLLSYGSLRRLVNKFTLIDYTKKVIADPGKYGAEVQDRMINKILVKLPFFMNVVPGYLWILVK